MLLYAIYSFVLVVLYTLAQFNSSQVSQYSLSSHSTRISTDVPNLYPFKNLKGLGGMKTDKENIGGYTSLGA